MMDEYRMREVFDPKAFVGISLINPEAFPE
jgi:hypothetical protein